MPFLGLVMLRTDVVHCTCTSCASLPACFYHALTLPLASMCRDHPPLRSWYSCEEAVRVEPYTKELCRSVHLLNKVIGISFGVLVRCSLSPFPHIDFVSCLLQSPPLRLPLKHISPLSQLPALLCCVSNGMLSARIGRTRLHALSRIVHRAFARIPGQAS